MARKEKIEKVAEFQKELEGKTLVFLNYQGLKVAGLTQLRTQLRQQGNRIKVFRNTLLKKTLTNLSFKIEDDTLLTGMTATAIFGSETFLGAGQALLEAEKEALVSIKGGFFEGKIMSPDLVRKYATMPSKEGLLAMLVGALSGVMANLVGLLEAVKEQKEAAQKGDQTT